MIRVILIALLLGACAKPPAYGAICKPAGGVIVCSIFPVSDDADSSK